MGRKNTESAEILFVWSIFGRRGVMRAIFEVWSGHFAVKGLVRWMVKACVLGCKSVDIRRLEECGY